ncbi:CHAT domain-containing tetratricopeptide repeat protein [Citromicrobium bathyomarinum]|uniref:CHAT domain-containing tetratricopeptide repeat protein n=1 Tax=Citromicrobium bathyomarinum TaxID=72174 RepID=UPI003159C31E
MRSIIWRSNNARLLLGGAALTMLSPALPAFAQESAEGDGATSAEGTVPLDPEAAQIVTEIEAIANGDPSADPEGDLTKLAELRARAEANGNVPLTDLGVLESQFGAAYFYLRDFEKALPYFDAAADFYTRGNAPLEEIAGLYNNQATILASLARYPESEEYHRKALAIRREMEGERGPFVASSLFGLGHIAYRQGRVLEALDYLRPAAEQTLEFLGPEDMLTSLRLTSLASVLGRAGYDAEAIETARLAVRLSREHLGEDHQLYGIAVNNLGHALMQARVLGEAIPVLREALRIRVATVGEDASGTAVSLRNLSQALMLDGKTEEAETLQRRAVEIYEKTGEVEDPFALATMYEALAEHYAMRGDWQGYDELTGKAIASADAAIDNESVEQALIHLHRADWWMRRGRNAEALAEAEHWVPVVRDAFVETHEDRIWSELLLARLRQLNGQDPSAYLPGGDAAMDVISGRLANVAVSDTTLVREARALREAALLYLDLGAALDDSARVFRAAQVANISELARGQQFARFGADDAATQQRERLLDLARKTNELRTRYRAALDEEDEAQAASLALEVEQADRAEREAADDLVRAYPEYVRRFRPTPVDLASLQSRLRPDDVLVVPVEGDRESWIIRVDTGGASWSPLDNGQLAEDVTAIRDAVERPNEGEFPLASSRRLFGQIFPDGTQGAHRVLLYGGQRLASVPFGLLTTADHVGDLSAAPWLIRDAAVQVVGNLDLLGEQRGDATTSPTVRFAGIGGVELPAGEAASSGGGVSALFRGGRPDAASIASLPALPGATTELREIADALQSRDSVLLIGADAAEDNVKRTDLSSIDILVFATHGLVAGEVTGLWEPALLLGSGDAGSGEDGLLGASEIARMRLPADWVILSACNTAAGIDGDGPTYSGLATAFAQAGAHAILLSHWRVRDDAAARLSVDTVRASQAGATRAEALRQAQLALLSDPQLADAANPAVWAPFVLIEN